MEERTGFEDHLSAVCTRHSACQLKYILKWSCILQVFLWRCLEWKAYKTRSLKCWNGNEAWGWSGLHPHSLELFLCYWRVSDKRLNPTVLFKEGRIADDFSSLPQEGKYLLLLRSMEQGHVMGTPLWKRRLRGQIPSLCWAGLVLLEAPRMSWSFWACVFRCL